MKCELQSGIKNKQKGTNESEKKIEKIAKMEHTTKKKRITR